LGEIGEDKIWRIITKISYMSYQHCAFPYTWSAVKSLARPRRKQAPATKLYLLQATQKQFVKLSVQLGLCVGRKVATFQLFFQSGQAKDLSAPLHLQENL